MPFASRRLRRESKRDIAQRMFPKIGEQRIHLPGGVIQRLAKHTVAGDPTERTVGLGGEGTNRGELVAEDANLVTQRRISAKAPE